MKHTSSFEKLPAKYTKRSAKVKSRRRALKGLVLGLISMVIMLLLPGGAQSGNGDALYIDEEGNVGIRKVPEKGIALDVNGKIRATRYEGDGSELTVDANIPLEGDKSLSNMLRAIKEAMDKMVPIGTILPYGGSEAPEGWLFCDGRELKRDEYQALYEVIGVNFGAPSNETFHLPDLRGRVAVGVNLHKDLPKRKTKRNLGENGGEETHQLNIDEMPKHFHENPVRGKANLDNEEVWALQATSEGVYGGKHGRPTDVSGEGQAHENMPPFLVVHYIIKY
jgi:microcystin-dependent protein